MTRADARRLTVVCLLAPLGILALCFGTVFAAEGHLWPSLIAFAFVPATILAGWFTDPGNPPQRPPEARQRPRNDPTMRALQNAMRRQEAALQAMRRNQDGDVYDWRTERTIDEFKAEMSAWEAEQRKAAP